MPIHIIGNLLSFALFQVKPIQTPEIKQMEMYIGIGVSVVAVLLLTIVVLVGILLNQRRLIHDLANKLMAQRLKQNDDKQS